MSKKVSLIVPVYNAERYLMDMAKSVLVQRYENFQLIFSDDGSTDNSANILTQLAAADSRIIVVLEQNGGVSAARNRALQLADGDYIGFCDADDMPEPEYLSTLVALLETYEADVACCGFTRIYETGVSDQMPQTGQDIFTTDRDGFYQLLLRPDGYTAVIWNKLFRREALLDTDGVCLKFDETLHIAEDGEWMFRCNICRAVFTPQPLYRYFVRRSGAMYGALTDRKKTELTARKKIVALSENLSPTTMALAKMKYQKGVRDLLFHAVIDGQGRAVRSMLPELSTYKKEFFQSPALSRKEKLKYRVYPFIIRGNLRRTGAFFMKTLSGH